MRQGRRGARAALVRACALAAAFALAACSAGTLRQPVTPVSVDAGQAAGAISAYRSANGLGPVSVDSRLMAAARDYARAMGRQDRINHRIGGSLAKRVTASGYDWSAAAENLAAGHSSLNAALDGWKRSSGHRANLLNPKVTEIGIAAVATPAGKNYWALILAAPPPERVPAGPFALGLVR